MHAEFGEGEQTMLPANRAAELSRQQTGPHGAGVVSECIDIADDRDFGVAWVRLGDGLAQPIASGGHERSVERAAHLQWHHLFGAEFFGDDGCRGDAFG